MHASNPWYKFSTGLSYWSWLFRWLQFFVFVFQFVAIQIFCLLLPTRLISIAKIHRQYSCKWICKSFGAQIQVIGHISPTHPTLWIGNHVSWLDPIILSSLYPVPFVTSTDVKGHPFLGFMTRLAGCVFVNRSGSKLKEEIPALSHKLGKHCELAFYPEGTTSDGTALLPFRSSLFELAFILKAQVQMVRTQYIELNHNAITHAQASVLYYFGNITFWQSLCQIMKQKSWVVELHLSDLVSTDVFSNRKELASHSERWLRKFDQ